MKSNVVRLPTAARRQVQQKWNRWTRAAKQELREACPWPAEYIAPGRRRALEDAKKIAGVDQTPALAIVLALVRTLDEGQFLRLIRDIAANGGPAAADAIALVNAQKLTVGRALDLQWALERVRSEVL
jgi:hypothetical protein